MAGMVVPQSGQKISPPPPAPVRVVSKAGSPRGVSSISLATGSHLIDQEARYTHKNPQPAAAQLNAPPSEMKGKAKYWQTGNA